MKNKLRVMGMLLVFTVLAAIPAKGVLAANNGKQMEKAITSYQAGKYKAAKKYSKKLPAKANEACVKKMPKAMKKAYKKVVKSYKISWDVHMSAYMWGYYLTDIDNDKKAELLVQYGSCEADVRLRVYKYENGVANMIGQVGCAHSGFFAYPGHEGIVVQNAHMGYESIMVLKVVNGKLQYESYGSRDCTKGADYMNLGLALNSHIKYDKNYKARLVLSDLK